MELDFKDISILIVGDLMLDAYIYGTSSRISQEAPVPVVAVSSHEDRLGGACNVASNIASLGGRATLCGIVGRDENAKRLRRLCDSLDINTGLLLTHTTRPTTTKQRVIIGAHQIARLDYEIASPYEDSIYDALYDGIKKEVASYDALILSDYGKGALSPALCAKLISLFKSHGRLVLADPKGRDYTKYKGVDIITPNKKEAKLASDMSIKTREDLSSALSYLQDLCSLTYPLITLGDEGIGLSINGEVEVIETMAQEVFDVTGAGDTVIASLALSLVAGNDIYASCLFANKAAAVVVGKVGSATASIAEIYRLELSKKIVSIKEYLRINGPTDRLSAKTTSQNSDLSRADGDSKCATPSLAPPSNSKTKVVFTNGCFDILHTGHIAYLKEAKTLGDILVIGLNSDASVRRLKGRSRPINGEIDRAHMLEALSFVDFIIIFEEDTPYELIRAISPDILVKGADYKDKEVVGSDLVGEVVLLPFIEGKSTTSIIKKVIDNNL